MDTTIIEELAGWMLATDLAGLSLFFTVFILLTLFFFPASPLTIVAGFVYGLLVGTVVASFAGLISAVLAFLISRYLVGERIQAWLVSFPRAQAINSAISSDGFRVVFLFRLASILPFIPLSYFLGMSRVLIRQYTLATWLGLLPGTILYVFIGSLFSEVNQISRSDETVSHITGALSVAGGIVATITLAMIIRRTRRILNHEVTHKASIRCEDLRMTKPVYVQEYNEIVKVLNQYNEGGKQANSSIMKPAFSKEATIFGVDGAGKLTGGPIQGLFDIIDSAFRPSPEAHGVIVNIDIVGTAASARIDTNDISGFCFTDFFNLLKVDGKWTVVSKIYHTHVAP